MLSKKNINASKRDIHRKCFAPASLSPLFIIALLSGCETADAWWGITEPSAQKDLQQGSLEAPDTPPPEAPRTTVTCSADDVSQGASFMLAHVVLPPGSPESAKIADGTWPPCPPPPCSIEPSSGATEGDITVYFAVSPSYFVSVLGAPMLTIEGVLKGNDHTAISTRTFGPLPPISLDDVDHTVALTVDAAEFASVTTATLSWIAAKPAEASSAQASSPSSIVGCTITTCFCP